MKDESASERVLIAGTEKIAMAPRGKPRKPRLSRMDAAVDAMLPLGFPEKLVRGKVKVLLKEYGGDEGWPFIEADAYKILIDMFLDEQEEEVEDNPTQDERAGDHQVADDVGPSVSVPALVCFEATDTAAQAIETEVRDHPLSAEGEREGWRDIDLNQICVEKSMVDTTGKADNDSRRAKQPENTPLHSPQNFAPSLQPVNSGLPTNRHKPCYGWISSDDEEDDFMELTPAMPVKSLGYHISWRHKKQRKRKTRWDVRLEDL